MIGMEIWNYENCIQSLYITDMLNCVQIMIILLKNILTLLMQIVKLLLRIEEMRQNINKAFAAFNFESKDRLQKELQGEKRKMKKIYNTIQEEELDEMIKQVETADIRQKDKESWELINTITGRKTAKKGLIKGNSKEERVNRWFENVNNILCIDPLLTE